MNLQYKEYLEKRLIELTAREKIIKDNLVSQEKAYYGAIYTLVKNLMRSSFLELRTQDEFDRLTEYVTGLHDVIYIKDEINDILNRQRHLRMMESVDEKLSIQREEEKKC